jgi:hypothetical protein
LRTLKSVYGVARAVVPIGYCGYLLYYFLGVGGSVENAWDIGLGPTLLGLGVVALLFCVPLFFKIMRLIGGPRWPRSGGRPNPPPGHGDGDDADGFDADAAIARYMARKAQEESAASPPPAQQRGGSPARPSFGRKSG